MGVKSWVKKKAKQGKKAVEKGANKVKDGITDAAREAEKGVNAAIDRLDEETRGKVMSIIDDVRKLVEETTSKKGPIWKLRKETWDKITSLGERVESKVEAKGKAVIDGLDEEIASRVKSALSEIDDAVTDKLPQLAERVFVEKLPELVTKQAPKIAVELADGGLDVAKQVAGEVQQAITGPGLGAAKMLLQSTYGFMVDVKDDAPELVQYLDSPGFGTTIGPMHLKWSGMYTRAETILGVFDRWIESPPKWSRRDIRELLTSFGPDEIDFDIDVSVNIVVVGSKIMAIGGDIPAIPFPLAVYGLDKLLEAAGVPE